MASVLRGGLYRVIRPGLAVAGRMSGDVGEGARGGPEVQDDPDLAWSVATERQRSFVRVFGPPEKGGSLAAGTRQERFPALTTVLV